MKVSLARLKDRRTSDVLDFPVVESLALSYLGSSLSQENYNVDVVDEEVQDISRKEVLEKLGASNLVGFTATARPQIYSVLEVSRRLRQRGYMGHITAGGHFPTFMFRELLENSDLDSVVLYEGEKTLSDLVRTVESGGELSDVRGIAYKKNGRVVRNLLRTPIENLDLLPFPVRDVSEEVIRDGGLPVISSSRGCYNRCSYCTISSFYGDAPGRPFRLRSAENVSRELVELKSRFSGLRDIWFVDDNFVQKGEQGRRRTIEICESLKQLDLRFDIYLRADDTNEDLLRIMTDSGLRSVFIGAEAGTNKTLEDIFRKRITVEQTKRAIKLCREFGVNVDPGFIMFHPWSTMEEIGENIKFLDEVGDYTPYGIASFLTAYRFTPIGIEMLSGKRTYRPSRIKSEDPLQDDIPYEIQDFRAELLLDLTLKSFQGFKELPRTLGRLKSEARKRDDQILFKLHTDTTNYFKEISMHFFKELYEFLSRKSLQGIQKYYENVSEQIRDSTFATTELVNLVLQTRVDNQDLD